MEQSHQRKAIKGDARFIGANAIDFSGYPDCRKEYFDGWNELIKVGMKNPVADATPAF
jgi:7-cyano-7-deazaguanine synthase